MLRRATHAGSWYEGSEKSLNKQLSECFTDNEYGPGQEPTSLNLDNRTIIGGVSPHAGIVYSGKCAAHTYYNLFKEKIPDTIIILGTIHRSYNNIAIYDKGEWETPIGNLSVDEELAKKISSESKLIKPDISAFTQFYQEEHNIEIQLPFIKYCSKNSEVNILPIKLGIQAYRNVEVCDTVAKDLASSISNYDKDVVIVASSDMQHETVSNLSQLDNFKEKDKQVINAFTKLEAKEVFQKASKMSICGPQTITTLIFTCKKIGATDGKLLNYYTSADLMGLGFSVGYFSGIIVK